MNRDEFVVRSRAPSIARGILIALITIALGAGMTWVWITQSTYAAVGDAYPAELMPVSMILDGDIEFDEYAPNPEQLPYWYKHVKGRTISFYPIVPGLMNWPVFYVAYLQGVDIKSNVQGLTHWTCAIVSACSVSLMFLALIGLTRHVGLSIFMVLIYMFATEVFSVTGRALWQHGPSLFFLTGALAAMFADRKWLYAIAGFMLGMAVWNRPTNIAFAIPLATYVAIFRPRWFWVLAAGGFFPAAGLAWYSLHYWGTLRSLGQGHFSAATHGPHQTSLGGEFLPGFAGVMFSPARGLFIHSPIFLLAMPAMLCVSSIWPNDLSGGTQTAAGR